MKSVAFDGTLRLDTASFKVVCVSKEVQTQCFSAKLGVYGGLLNT